MFRLNLKLSEFMRQLKITPKITHRTKSVERYFSEIEKENLITQEQEIELAQRIRAGDKEAEEILIKANLRFVVSVAKKYSRSEMPLEDVINEGNIGLIKAAKKFDETRGFKFISYAVWWIRQSIIESMPTHIRSIRIPLNVTAAHEKIKKWSMEFEQKNEREPSILEICEQFDMETANYKKINSHCTGGESSLDKPIGEDETGTFADLLPSEKIDTYDIIENEDRIAKVREVLDLCLTHMERDIICMAFGIGIERSEGLSNDEIGRQYSLSPERIRQIKEKCLRKLRQNQRCLKILTDLK